MGDSSTDVQQQSLDTALGVPLEGWEEPGSGPALESASRLYVLWENINPIFMSKLLSVRFSVLVAGRFQTGLDVGILLAHESSAVMLGPGS